MERSTHTTKTLVLGAGYAGLTAAALLAHEGSDVTVLESHETLGGCGSFFREGRYTFDVGATTFSAVQPHQPVGMVFGHLGLAPRLERIDPGMVIRMGGADVIRHADKDRWIGEVSTHFPRGDHEGFWNEMYRLEQRVYDLIAGRSYLPPATAMDWLRMMSPSNLDALPLLRGLLTPMHTVMKRYGVDSDPAFVAFIDEQLLISTQSTSPEAPYLTGAMGLTYPSETYYPVGGMVRPAIQLLRHVTSLGGTVRFRRHVTAIREVEGGWEVRCSNGEVYRSEQVISSIPIWNMVGLTQGRMQRYYLSLASRFTRSWGAFTMYFVLEGVPKLPAPYMQLHLNDALPFVHSRSLFLSLSRPDDGERAPEGETVVTVSTHVRAEEWQGMTLDEHQQQKDMVTQAVQKVIMDNVPEFAGMAWKHTSSATPLTWVKYTARHTGFVGGIPHSVRQPLLTLPRNATPFAGMYQIGDSAFPGQGTPAVMLGAWNVVDRILNRRLTRSFVR